ncbi:MAG: tRNA(Ile)(2)-agmatinylcytidine synthase [Thermoplasmata archaeon]
MYIAVDDTDSRYGMCTTFLVTELIKEFSEYKVIHYPRLVRLNPNIPWKTRGNGAVVIELGKKGIGEIEVGNIEEPVLAKAQKGEDIEEKKETILLRVIKLVDKWGELDIEGTNPGVVIGREKPPVELYWKTVREVVKLDEIIDILDAGEFCYKGYGNKRGLIGAAAAMSWIPEDHTYELISYRKKELWGTGRDMPEEDVIELDNTLKSTFDSYDHQESSSTIAPNSPCPVLYGVRGDDPDELKKSLDLVGGEEPERWLLFLTNQGTDDHIVDSDISEIEPYRSVHVRAAVSSKPRVIEGGHVFIDLKNGQKVTAAAYEPTKDFRKIIKSLIPGDIIEIWGGVREEPETLNIEKIKIVHIEEKCEKIGNPVCPKCGKRMSSIGKDAGYRCKRCSTKAGENEVEMGKVDRALEEGWYETPVSARRHLSKPLKRMEILSKQHGYF